MPKSSSSHNSSLFAFFPHSSLRSLVVGGAFLLSTQIACSDDAGVGDGGGGSPAAGGSVSSGGSLSTGGTAGTGAAVGSGGSSLTGGASSGGAFTTGGASAGGSSAGGTGGGLPSTGGSGSGGDGAGGSGSGGELATGGSGGTVDAGYQPCPADDTCKILPFGDSITDGIGYGGGYRVKLFSLALADSHDITFTGTHTPNGPDMVDGVSFPRNHEGHSGWTIEQVDGLIPSPALDEMPHIILLHIGTNDMAGSAGSAPGRLETLLDNVIAAAPDALLVVSSIIPFTNVETYNATIEPMVDARASAGAHIIYVDQYDGFPTGELGDGVHPNQAGYERMAGVWYDGISSYLR